MNQTIKSQYRAAKTMLPLFVVAFFLTCVWSCEEEDTLNLSTSEILLDDKDEGQFSISSNTLWQISPTDSWVQLSKYSGTGSGEIIVNAKSKNNELETRKISLNITAGSLSKQITIIQNALPKLEVDSTIINFTAKGSENKFHISTNQEWTASSNEKWCVIKQTMGDSSTTVTVVAETNESLKSRDAEITVKSTINTCKIMVRQAGAAPFVKPETNSLTFDAEAGSKSINIDSNIDWTATCSNTTWCTIKKESKSITVSVKKNETIETRKATINLKGEGITPQEIEVIQTAGEGYLTISKSLISFSPAENEESFSISSNMKWTVQSNQSWCSVNQSSGQNNSSAIKVKVSKNTTSDIRNAVITIKGETGISHEINITQAKPELIVNTSDISFTSSGGTIKRDVTANINWKAESNSTSWCTVTYTTTSLSIVAEKNTSLSKRTATISITGDGISSKTIIVSQEAGSPILEISPSSLKFFSQAGSKPLTITTNMAWEATSDQSWCVITSKGNGTATKEVSVQENKTNSDRKAKITIKAGELSRIVNIEQEKHATLSVNEHSFSVSESSNTKNVNITSNTSWEIKSSQSWCRVSKSTGSGNASISIYIDSNSTSYERKATLTITGGGLTETIVIAQKETISITVSPSQLEFYYNGGIKSADLKCDNNISWVITAPSFITVSPSSGSGSKQLQITDQYWGGVQGGKYYIYIKDKKYNVTRTYITVKIK